MSSTDVVVGETSTDDVRVFVVELARFAEGPAPEPSPALARLLTVLSCEVRRQDERAST